MLRPPWPRVAERRSPPPCSHGRRRRAADRTRTPDPYDRRTFVRSKPLNGRGQSRGCRATGRHRFAADLDESPGGSCRAANGGRTCIAALPATSAVEHAHAALEAVLARLLLRQLDPAGSPRAARPCGRWGRAPVPSTPRSLASNQPHRLAGVDDDRAGVAALDEDQRLRTLAGPGGARLFDHRLTNASRARGQSNRARARVPWRRSQRTPRDAATTG
jgi:hypothetical protein